MIKALLPRATLILTAAVAALLAATPAVAQAKVKTHDPGSLEIAESLPGNFLSALVAGSARDSAAAAVFLREALKADPRNFDLVQRQFEAQLANGNMDEALRLAQRIFARDNRNGVARLVLGLKSLKEGKFAEARSRVVTSGRRPEADITGALLRAWISAGAKEFDAALKGIDDIKGDAGLGSFKDYHAGLIAEVGGRMDEAEKRLKSAYSATPRAPVRLVQAYGALLARKGDIEGAKKVFADFEKRVARHPLIGQLAADLSAGKPLPQHIASAAQGAAEVLFGLGTEAARQDEAAAIVYLRLARYLDPQHDYALVTLGDVYEKLKRYEAAIDAYQELPPNSPLSDSARVQVALNLSALKRDDEAIAILKEIVAKNPGDIEAFSGLGNLLRGKKRYEEAIETYTKGLAAIGSDDPSLWSIYYFRGSAHERAKNWPKAEADLKKALELQPDNAQVLNYLGYSWVDQFMHIDEAFKMLEKAVSLAPRDGYIVDSLGWAYYRLGKYEDAVRELEKAVTLRPADPTINDHLGDAYWQVGRKLEAGFQWNHARDLLLRKKDDEGLDDTEAEELTKVLAKLKDGLPPVTPPAPPPAKAEGEGQKEKGGG